MASTTPATPKRPCFGARLPARCTPRRHVLAAILALPVAAAEAASAVTAGPAVSTTVAADVQAQAYQQQQQYTSNQETYRQDDPVDIRSILAALALLSGSFLLVLLGLRLYLHCVHRRPERKERKAKMTQEDVESRFPVVTCAAPSEETCVICLSNIEEGDECRVTQCGHTFHADCLLSWWMYKPRRNLRCPMCRTRQRKRERKSKQASDSGAEPSVDVEASPTSEVDDEADRHVKVPLSDAIRPSLGDRACSMRSEDCQTVVIEDVTADPELGCCSPVLNREVRDELWPAKEASPQHASVVITVAEEAIQV